MMAPLAGSGHNTENFSGTCYHCGQGLESSDFGRKESCPHCGRDTRVCKNCTHYDPSYHNECKETQADRVVEKERSNFCDYFHPSHSDQKEKASQAEDLRAAAEKLFKK